MIEARSLTKKFGKTVAVDDISFSIGPGKVTGFLGPNGAGKTTTMRMILGLDNPSSGTVTVNGRSYEDLPAPMHEAGALLDARAIQGGRSAYRHLQWLAKAGGIPKTRVDQVLDLVGLQDAARKRVGDFSLGMSQRLGIAAALLGDPPILLFDEPVNGLDPEGIYWVRTFLRRLATEGRTVVVSSHLMSEMQETADHILLIGQGRLIADTTTAEFMQQSTESHVRVRSPRLDTLKSMLKEAGAAIDMEPDGAAVVTNMEASQIGDLAVSRGIALHELAPQRASLEKAFMEVTQESVQYRSASESPDGSRTAEEEFAEVR
jgi:ABC-2 type transport system ATP-binding protein